MSYTSLSQHSYVNHTAATVSLLTVLCATRSSSKPLCLCPMAPKTPLRYSTPYSYSRWHYRSCESSCFYALPHSQRRDNFMHNFQRKSVCFMLFSSLRESMSLFLMTLSFTMKAHLFMPESTHITMDTLMFIPDSTLSFHRKPIHLCLIASPRPTSKVSMMLSSKPPVFS